MPSGKIYFASDVHLGTTTVKNARAHEQLFVRWLDTVKADAAQVFLLGDIFDYWYEYKTVAPRGFVRMLGKICEMTDAGIEVHFFTGNHDVWVFDYLPSECGITVHQSDIDICLAGKQFRIGHGDEVGRYDRSYMLLKAIFKSRIAQWFYSLIHPDLAGWFATTWSHQSRKTHQNSKSHEKYKSFMGADKEHQILMARDLLAAGRKIDYFVYGHRHVAFDYALTPDSHLYNVGDWLRNFTYGVFDPEEPNHFDVKHFVSPAEGLALLYE